MSLSAKLRRAPLRIATGAYILNSGVTKLGADDEAAKSMHDVASGTYPVVDKVQPRTFARMLGVGEIAVGGTLLLPMVPPMVAGAALVGFSGALLNMYWRTPGMHEEGSLRPTQQGAPVLKDVWMLGIGLGLMADATLEPAHDRVVEMEATAAHWRADRSRRARRKMRKARRANAEHLKRARESAVELQAHTARRAQKAAKKAAKRAESASESAAARLAEMRAEYAPVAAEKARHARDVAVDAAHEYGPVVAKKARRAKDSAVEVAHEYGPVAAEKARQARDTVRDTVRELADEYGPIAAEKAAQARESAEALSTVAAEKAREAGHTAKKKGARARLRLVS